METRTVDKAKENVENFAKRYLNLLLKKREIDQDVKALKDEFKEEGVPVSIVTSVINKIKVDKKKSDTEKFEMDVIREWLEGNVDIDNDIGVLIAK